MVYRYTLCCMLQDLVIIDDIPRLVCMDFNNTHVTAKCKT